MEVESRSRCDGLHRGPVCKHLLGSLCKTLNHLIVRSVRKQLGAQLAFLKQTVLIAVHLESTTGAIPGWTTSDYLALHAQRFEVYTIGIENTEEKADD